MTMIVEPFKTVRVERLSNAELGARWKVLKIIAGSKVLSSSAYDQEQINTEHRKATTEMRSRGLL